MEVLYVEVTEVKCVYRINSIYKDYITILYRITEILEFIMYTDVYTNIYIQRHG